MIGLGFLVDQSIEVSPLGLIGLVLCGRALWELLIAAVKLGRTIVRVERDRRVERVSHCCVTGTCMSGKDAVSYQRALVHDEHWTPADLIERTAFVFVSHRPIRERVRLLARVARSLVRSPLRIRRLTR